MLTFLTFLDYLPYLFSFPEKRYSVEFMDEASLDKDSPFKLNVAPKCFDVFVA